MLKAMIVKRRKARGAPRSETISDLVSLKEDRAQAALKAWIREWLLRVYEDSRAKRMSSDDVFLAASKNRHVVNYLTYEFAFAASYGHCWRDDNLNFDPPERTNDTVDISLALSLTKGDVLLTADQKLTSMCRLASDEWDVFTWSDWVSRGH